MVVASIVVPGPPVEAEQLWHDRSRWASWIDGFGHLVKTEGEWPLEGARRVRQSREGIVAEQVVDHRAGRSQTVFVEDERTAGEQRVRFEGDAEATRITLELDVAPKSADPSGAPVVAAAQARRIAAPDAPALLLRAGGRTLGSAPCSCSKRRSSAPA